MLNIEEKRNKIREYCSDENCLSCPLFTILGDKEKCWSEGADIEKNYKILVDNGKLEEEEENKGCMSYKYFISGTVSANGSTAPANFINTYPFKLNTFENIKEATDEIIKEFSYDDFVILNFIQL